jgi:hypothetical protein
MAWQLARMHIPIQPSANGLIAKDTKGTGAAPAVAESFDRRISVGRMRSAWNDSP